MRYTKFLILIFIIAVFFTGCKKVLDVSPATSIDESLAYSTPEKCLASLNGVYDAAQSGFYAGGAVRGYPFGAANIEQGDMRGEDMHNNAAFYQITYESTYDPTTANNVFMWHTLYALINRANLVREGCQTAVSKGILTSSLANQYDAECRFLRAMAHHELLLNFARPYADNNGRNIGVTYRDTGINTLAGINNALAYNRPRDSVYFVYNKILADLDYAEANLPATANPFRATKAAAIALKMRIKMHMGDWSTTTGVAFEGAKLIPATGAFISPIGAYTLPGSPDGAFLNNSSTESIFSIKNDANDNPGVNGALPAMLGAPNFGGRGLVEISHIIWNSSYWRCDDLRRSLLAIRGNGAGASYYFTTKYKDVVSRTDAAPQIRYAEVLLMMTEAEARNAAGTTVSTRAVDLLNGVRNRALPASSLPGASYTVASFATKVDLVKAILAERRIELLAEGKRWGDIHRLALDATYGTGGIPTKVATTYATFATYNCAGGAPVTTLAGFPYSSFRFIWPIPSDETTANPAAAQNPGY
jgi:starch-binding outer membrane protein, SusD/RagB family